MSLRTSIKTDVASATGGVWFELAAYPNSDGTIPAFLMGQQSTITNPKFAAAMQRLAQRERPTNQQLSIDDGIKADSEVFVGGLLLDWRNFEPVEDGTKCPYSVEAAENIFSNPAWADLKSMLIGKASDKTNYSVRQRELAAKNSSASSVLTSTAGTSTKKSSTSKKPASEVAQ